LALAAGISIPASDISVRYRSITVLVRVPLFRYRTGSDIGILFYSGTGLTGEVYTADGGEGYTLHVHTLLLIMVNFLYDVEKSYVNVGTPECRKIVSLVSAFLPVVSCVSPASAFRKQG
jgi:hypothetical protein